MNKINKKASYFQKLSNHKTVEIIATKDIDNLFLINLNTNDLIELPIIPDSVSASYTANLVKTAPIGTIQPINYYVGGSAKEISFNITLHEDINHKENSIYKLLDDIKAMSEPVIQNNTLKPPSVYLQLGTQFAGKGHINTEIRHGMPFRNGRYLQADLSITFTYHEEYHRDNLDYLETYFVSEVTNEYNPEYIFGDNYNNFVDYETITDYEFLIKNTFNDKRLNEYLREAVSVVSKNDSLGGNTEKKLFDALTSSNSKLAYEVYANIQRLNFYTNDFLTNAELSLFRREEITIYYYIQLTTIMSHNTSNQVRLQNLKTLKKRIEAHIQNLKVTTETYEYEKYPKAWWDAYDEIIKLLNVLLDILNDQIKIHNILVGQIN